MKQFFDIDTWKVVGVSTSGTTAAAVLAPVAPYLAFLTALGTCIYVWLKVWRLWKGKDSQND